MESRIHQDSHVTVLTYLSQHNVQQIPANHPEASILQTTEMFLSVNLFIYIPDKNVNPLSLNDELMETGTGYCVFELIHIYVTISNAIHT